MAESKWLWPVPYTTNITQYYTGAYADGGHSGIDISDTGVSGKALENNGLSVCAYGMNG